MEQEEARFWLEWLLYDADENCEHDEQPALGGGVKCVKCGGWFCF